MNFKLRNVISNFLSSKPETLIQFPVLVRNCHFEPNLGLPQKTAQNNVAIFWDLDNKPPKETPPFEAAIKLKKAVSSFGIVRFMVAYANSHAFSYVPPDIREQRKERKLLNQLEKKGVIKPVEPYRCRVCGRRFYTNEKLMNHFKQIHEGEHKKRLSHIDSARGKKRVNLVGKYSMKMEKYRNAAREILIPRLGYGLADELKRAGFWVKTVSNKPQAADVALRESMVDVMDKKRAECLVLVSDDSDFVEVLNEAKMRCVRTVVVGDANEGALKRVADAAFCWGEILRGKAKKEAVSVVGKWKDRDVLKKLEWAYDPDEAKEGDFSEEFDEESENEVLDDKDDAESVQKEDASAWWEMSSDSDASCET